MSAGVEDKGFKVSRFQGCKVAQIVSGFGLRVSSGLVVIAALATGIDWAFDPTTIF
jgi:hypothetical protein